MKKYLTPLITLSLVVFLFPSLVVPDLALAQSNNYCADFYGNHLSTLNQDSNFTAHGFNRVEKSWEEVFGVPLGFGASSIAIPGTHMPETQRQYLTIPFTMTGDQLGNDVTSARFSYVELQGQISRTHPITLTISPCPGDFRAPTQTNIGNAPADPYLGLNCRFEYSISGNGSASSIGLSGCPAPKGKRMYLNVAAYDMFGSDADQPSGPCDGPCGVSVLLQ